MTILDHLDSRLNTFYDLYKVDYDDYNRPCLSLATTVAELSLRFGGNRVSITAKRKANQTSFRYRKRLVHGNTSLSRSASYRMVRYLRESQASYKALGTLTFDNVPTGRESRRAFNLWCKRVTHKFRDDKSFSLFWFREFQARGSVHYHFFSSERIGIDWLSRSWAECVAKGDAERIAQLTKTSTNIKSIRSGKHGMMTYASKYAKKEAQKQIPEGFDDSRRSWGIIGNRETAAASIELTNESMNTPELREKLQKFSEFMESAKKDVKAREKNIMTIDKQTGLERWTGVTVWDIWDVVRHKRLHEAFNELFDEPERRMPFPRGWLCEANNSSSRRNTKK